MNLAHELIHARGYLYDKAAYYRRDANKFPKNSPFPSEEEAYVIQKTNEIAARFGEAVRLSHTTEYIWMRKVVYKYQGPVMRE